MTSFPICPGIMDRDYPACGLKEGDPVWIMGFVYGSTDTYVIIADKVGRLHRTNLIYVRAVTPACVHSLASAR